MLLVTVPKSVIVLLIVTAIVVAITIVLYRLGKKTEARQAEQNEQIQKAAQTVSMLIIDKKRLRIKDSGLPQQVIDQTPWYAKRSKMPIVKAKVGPQIVNLICDAEVFETIPVKKEVKATVSGLYIVGVKGAHGKLETPEKKKRGLRAWATRKMKELNQSK
ncbi:MAG: hypothetical protein II571_00130 [Lachnospiraceae bacterium]|jgi:hypothetical protein|nr:hypothetical protein [Lachnospiraceae bacterium]MBQ2317118.1 hypothetical protein [Lachnospiraceae bacterium]MBQ2466361.1 hypothetical protein [Lachnospiraceae bacterium]MBQ2577817.1 hypothetical protein [Lachnospiraceae bacterium]MBQ4374116.1 hypothetical protein [Lachnospiraceae bacterium]